MRKNSKYVSTDVSGLLDICGTGGSGIYKFNISTVASIITASAGVPIAKHGNRQMSGKTGGSADVLEELGVNIDLTSEQARVCLEQTGICFLFAPLYHQSMKHAIVPRKELGFKTVFNILGPLTNPAGAKCQLIGVFSPSYLEKMARVLQTLGSEWAMIVHGTDGLDEITITGTTKVAELKEGKIDFYEINPEELGLEAYSLADIAGGSSATNATIIQNVLNGERGAYRDIASINAGASLYVANKVFSLRDGVRLAQELINSGKARTVLQDLISFTNSLRKTAIKSC
jgi:anthranilate phosphoribosyltransferase